MPAPQSLAISLLFTTATLAQSTFPTSQPLKPNLQFPTAAAYQAEIKEPALLLQSDHLWLFAPARKEKEARLIFKYLTAAYDDLHATTGLHTKYKIVVYHLPKAFGGTSECVIYSTTPTSTSKTSTSGAATRSPTSPATSRRSPTTSSPPPTPSSAGR